MKVKLVSAVLVNAAWLGFIFSNSLKSRADSANQSEGAEGFLRRVLTALGFEGDTEAVAEVVVRKAAHVFEFFVLCLLVYWLVAQLLKENRKALCISALVSVCSAAVDESLQLISKRGASVKDVIIDSIGVALAVVLLCFVKRIKDKRCCQ